MIGRYYIALRNKIVELPFVIRIVDILKTYKPWGFKGNSFYAVGKFFIDSMRQENIHLRASSLAYSFFLSLFPFLLFLLTLIAYIPVDNLKEEFLMNLSRLLPETSFSALKGTIVDILQNQRGGLLSIGLLTAIFFSSNGIMTLITALNRSLPIKTRRPLMKKRTLAIGMTIVLILILILTITILLWLNLTEVNLLKSAWLSKWIVIVVFFLLETGTLMLSLLVIISGIYYVAPAQRKGKEFTFISPGSMLATFLIIGTTVILQYYINNIFAYHSLYGSIGAIIALLVLLYFNAMCILVGFELNRSIEKAINSRLESRPHILKNMDEK